MIICDDIDLFGGRISIISTQGFCCQIETAGERLRLAPSTVVHDLLQLNGGNSSKPAASLFYETTGNTEGLLARHKTLVDFLDLLARSDSRLQLSSALQLARREFSHFGDWKWPDAATTGLDTFAVVPLFSTAASEAHDFPGRINVPVPYADTPAAWLYRSHADSPLAD